MINLHHFNVFSRLAALNHNCLSFYSLLLFQHKTEITLCMQAFRLSAAELKSQTVSKLLKIDLVLYRTLQCRSYQFYRDYYYYYCADENRTVEDF